MKKMFLTALIGASIWIGPTPLLASQNHAQHSDLSGEIAIGITLGEKYLKQTLSTADELAHGIPNVEGTVLLEIGGKIVRVMKGNGIVVEIFDNQVAVFGKSGAYENNNKHSWKKAEEKKREAWKRHQELERERAKKIAERERERWKKAAKQARKACKKHEGREGDRGNRE